MFKIGLAPPQQTLFRVCNLIAIYEIKEALAHRLVEYLRKLIKDIYLIHLFKRLIKDAANPTVIL